MEQDERELAFFHRPSTHALIDDLSDLAKLTIYVGAGASTERTGLTWGGLIAQLLSPDLGDYKKRTQLADTLSPAHASSAAVENFRNRYPSSVRERVMESLRSLIYQGDDNEWTFGHFNERVATLVDQLYESGVSVCVVTTNYDDFLLRDLREADARINEITIGRATSDAAKVLVKKRLEQIATDLASDEAVTVLHLHGLLTSKGRDEVKDDIYPVVTEDDYLSTEDQSARALRTAFEDRNVLILGASITDPPLIRALLATKPTERLDDDGTSAPYKRYAFQALQGIRPLEGESIVDPAIIRLHELRLNHLGVIGVYSDFYIQIPQILEEVRHTLALRADGFCERYASPTAIHRYGTRLVGWWHRWMFQDSDLRTRQAAATDMLEKRIASLRSALGAPIAEPLKIEMWLRWNPDNSRDLKLWATSTGTQTDHTLMRYDTISLQSQFVAVRTFATGSPMFAEGSGRWRSFLAKPIWFQHDIIVGHEDIDEDDEYNLEFAGGTVPVGVICIGSMWPQDESAISPQRRQRTVVTLGLLDELGQRLVDPRGIANENDDAQPRADTDGRARHLDETPTQPTTSSRGEHEGA